MEGAEVAPLPLAEVQPKLDRWPDGSHTSTRACSGTHNTTQTGCIEQPRRAQPTWATASKSEQTKEKWLFAEVLVALERQYPSYETNLSIRTEIQNVAMLPNNPKAARISELLADLDHWVGRLTPGSYGNDEMSLKQDVAVHKTTHDRRDPAPPSSSTHGIVPP